MSRVVQDYRDIGIGELKGLNKLDGSRTEDTKYRVMKKSGDTNNC